MKLEHIIFDFDGVIADTFDILWPLSQIHDDTATLEDFVAHHDGNVFAEPRIKFKPERAAEFKQEYRRLLTTDHIVRARASLQRLGEHYSLHIVSSNGEEAIKDVLRDAALLPLFLRILGRETHQSKVEKFTMLMKENGVTSENAIFVTDTLGDVKEAHNVGIRTIAETFGFHDRERLLKGNPFKVVDTWEEIEEVIASLER